ncbi:MAG: LuxR C-terminal-related transcriptional regulator [Muribaculaceae bacterium]|nr:LuxR C-terminal-related transcriptional regulator [Muribaculaceae bacterium]MDE6321524.1 LuxR C-terminal-related transcriptional regulator [Muribaculaceae bacterium]
MKTTYTIAIVTQSEILKCGLETMLSCIRSVNLRTVTIPTERAYESIIDIKPSVILVDPLELPSEELVEIKQNIKTSILAIGWSAIPDYYKKVVDGVVGMYDSVEKLSQVISAELKSVKADESDLTPREQEIVAWVAKGKSNKQIACEMNLAVNTVMTHRRNIASKLHIHSSAGLTIFALMNKLVSLEEVAK